VIFFAIGTAPRLARAGCRPVVERLQVAVRLGAPGWRPGKPPAM
jgi:hypothetical protein